MRKSGFYWVKIHNDWVIAEYFQSSDIWEQIGSEKTLSDIQFQDIDEKRIERIN